MHPDRWCQEAKHTPAHEAHKVSLTNTKLLTQTASRATQIHTRHIPSHTTSQTIPSNIQLHVQEARWASGTHIYSCTSHAVPVTNSSTCRNPDEHQNHTPAHTTHKQNSQEYICTCSKRGWPYKHNLHVLYNTPYGSH